MQSPDLGAPQAPASGDGGAGRAAPESRQADASERHAHAVSMMDSMMLESLGAAVQDPDGDGAMMATSMFLSSAAVGGDAGSGAEESSLFHSALSNTDNDL